MKTAKNVLSFALVLTLLLSLSIPVFADGASYQNTQAFLREIDGYTDLSSTLVGVIDFAGENYERVKLSYKGDASDYTSNFSILFNEDEEDIVVYMGQVIKFDESRLSEVLEAVNRINAQTTGMKLYVDTSDNTVSAELEAVCRHLGQHRFGGAFTARNEGFRRRSLRVGCRLSDWLYRQGV